MSDDELPIRVEPTTYMVTKYPEGGVNASHFTVLVERRAPGKWAVTYCGQCYRADGTAEYEPLPSSREDDFKARTRFSLEEATELAKSIVADMRLGKGPNRPGQTAEEVWEWEQGRKS